MHSLLANLLVVLIGHATYPRLCGERWVHLHAHASSPAIMCGERCALLQAARQRVRLASAIKCGERCARLRAAHVALISCGVLRCCILPQYTNMIIVVMTHVN